MHSKNNELKMVQKPYNLGWMEYYRKICGHKHTNHKKVYELSSS